MEDNTFQIEANAGSLDLENDSLPITPQEELDEEKDLKLLDSSFHSTSSVSDTVSESDEHFSRRLEHSNVKTSIARGVRNDSPFSTLMREEVAIDIFNIARLDDMILKEFNNDKDQDNEEHAQASSLTGEDNTASTTPTDDHLAMLSDGSYNNENLAIAVKVPLEEGTRSIPRAVEYDPTLKPPLYANRRFRFYMLSTILFILIIGIGALSSLIVLQDNIQSTPTVLSAGDPEKVRIIENIIEVVGRSSLALDSSPHALAADWILNKDPLQLSEDSENLIQRYLLALFYFSTTQRRPWKSCNPPSANESAECNYTKLLQVFPELQYNVVPAGRWLSEKHECEWAGVMCQSFNEGTCVGIELSGQDIVGTLPTSLSMLSNLQFIALGWNDFYGTVPAGLFHMNQLAILELQYNMLTGQLPFNQRSKSQMAIMALAGNLLSGTIPSGFRAPQLRALYIQDNQISGTIPAEIGKLALLSFLRLEKNFLTGTLPSEIGNLAMMKELWLHGNELTGSLPREIGNMLALVDLRLHNNYFDGSIPEELYSIPQLRRWDIQNCNFTGTISTGIGQLSTLQAYRISNNSFYGTIPSEMGGLDSLSVAWLHYNNLTGTVPQEMCSLGPFGGLSDLQSDCDRVIRTDDSLVNCTCCKSPTDFCNDFHLIF